MDNASDLRLFLREPRSLAHRAHQIELCRQYSAMHFGEDAAEKALSNEDEREEHLKCERMPRRVEEAEQRVGVRTPRSADKDTQFSE